MSRRRVLAAGATVVLVALVAVGGWVAWERTHPSYCEVVADRQDELTELGAEGGASAVFGALDTYRDLRDAAPGDIRDEWDLVISRLAALEEAVVDAGLDPGRLGGDGLDDQALADLDEQVQDRVRDAARALADPTTMAAMGDLEQQALDVCHTPLAR